MRKVKGHLPAAAALAAAAVFVASCSGASARDSAHSSGGSNSAPSTSEARPAENLAVTVWWERWSQDPCSVLTDKQLKPVGLEGVTGDKYPPRPGSQVWSCMWRGDGYGITTGGRETQEPRGRAFKYYGEGEFYMIVKVSGDYVPRYTDYWIEIPVGDNLMATIGLIDLGGHPHQDRLLSLLGYLDLPPE